MSIYILLIMIMSPVYGVRNSLMKTHRDMGPTIDHESQIKRAIKTCSEDLKIGVHASCPPCSKSYSFLHFGKESCYKTFSCPEGQMLSSSCMDCVDADDCKTTKQYHFDDIICQDEPLTGRFKIQERTDVCSVNNWEIKTCKHKEEKKKWIYWILFDTTMLIVDKSNVRWNQIANKVSAYSCKANDNMTNCNEILCKDQCRGDKYFCENFPCRIESPCYCTWKKSPGVLTLITDKGDVVPRCTGRSLVQLGLETPPESPEVVKMTKSKFDCTPRGILFMPRQEDIKYIVICKSPYCVSREIKDTESVDIVLPDEVLINSGEIRVDVWVKGETSPSILKRTCPPIDSCSLIDCVYCIKRWSNVHCYTYGNWIIVSLSGFILFLILSVILYVTSILLGFTRCVLQPAWVCCRMCHRALSGRIRVVVDKYKEKREELDAPNDVVVIDNKCSKCNQHPCRCSKSGKYNATKRGVPPVLFIICGLVLSSPCVSGCTNTQTVNIKAPQCTYNDQGAETCTVVSNIRIALSPMGQTTCIMLNDPTNKPIGSLMIETIKVTLNCQKNSLYWTGDAEHSCVSLHHCRSVGNCEDDKCENTKPDDQIPGHERDSKDLGWTKCRRVCGCAGCGCGLCSSACLWYRSGIVNPTGKAYEVFDCPQWVFNAHIKVIRNSISEIQDEEVVLTPGKLENVFGFTIGLISISQPPQPILNKCFVQQGRKTAIVDCNKRLQYVMGQVGEIQCPDLQSAQKMRNCISSEAMVNVVTHDNTVTCSSNILSVSKILEENLLPFRTTGMLISGNSDEVHADLNEVALLEMQIDSTIATFTAKTDLNKCVANFKELSGCYSCASGAKLKIDVNTNFGSAIGGVECSNGWSFPIEASEESKTKEVILHANTPNIKISCVIKCPAGTNNFTVSGTLIYIPNKDDRISETEKGMIINPPDNGFKIGSLFTDQLFGSWWKISLWIIGAVIMIVFWIWFYYYIRTVRNYNIERKMT